MSEFMISSQKAKFIDVPAAWTDRKKHFDELATKWKH